MNYKTFNQNTFNLTIPKGAPLQSEQLNAFFHSIYKDFNSLADIINNTLNQFLASLPATFEPSENQLDGTQLYVDSNASESKDRGIFYNSLNQRPITIYEALLFIVQLISNLNNTMRDAQLVASYYNPTTEQTITVPWPYENPMFVPILFEVNPSNGTITEYDKSNYTISLSNSIITINRNDTNPIFGIIWHPNIIF